MNKQRVPLRWVVRTTVQGAGPPQRGDGELPSCHRTMRTGHRGCTVAVLAVVLWLGAAAVLGSRRLASIQGAYSAFFVLVLPSLWNSGSPILDAAIDGVVA